MSTGRDFRLIEGGNAAPKLDSRPVSPRTYIPVELPEEESVFDRSMVIGMILALLLGTPLTIWMLREARILAAPEKESVVEVSIVEPTPPPEPEPPPPPPPPPKKKPKVVEFKAPTRSAPAPTEEVVAETPPKRFELTLASTTTKSSSGMAISVGSAPSTAPGAAYGDPDVEDAPAKVRYSRLESPPRLLREFKADYPETSRAEGIEGTVVMKLTISEQGRVTSVRIIRGINEELDAATKQAARKLLFKPGVVDGEPVITTGYVLRYTWELNE